MRWTHGLACIVACLLSVPAAAAPNHLNYSGKLDTGSGSFTGSVDITFSLYPTATDAHFWQETQAVSVVDGRFHVKLGANTSNPLVPGDLAVAALHVGIKVATDGEMDKELISSVPYAMQASEATNAQTVGGKAASAFSASDHTHTDYVTLSDLSNYDDDKSDDLTITTAFTGDVTGTYNTLAIGDDTISDVHIAPGAAIAGSKIEPSFEGHLEVTSNASSHSARIGEMPDYGLFLHSDATQMDKSWRIMADEGNSQIRFEPWESGNWANTASLTIGKVQSIFTNTIVSFNSLSGQNNVTLDVAGMVHAKGDGFKFPDGTIQSTAATGGGGSSSSSSGGGNTRMYQAVIVVNMGEPCPINWEELSFTDARGPNGNAHFLINGNGTFIGGIDDFTKDQEFIAVRVSGGSFSNQDMATICTRSFKSSSGRPHVSMHITQQGIFTPCVGESPETTFQYMLGPGMGIGDLNGTASALTIDDGFYLGPSDLTKKATSHDISDEGGGWQDWTFSFEEGANLVCVRIMGVDADEKTKDGVFPVYVTGIPEPSGDPEQDMEWTPGMIGNFGNANGEVQLGFTRSASIVGAAGNEPNIGGGAYQYFKTLMFQVNDLNWRYFKMQGGKPRAQIRTPRTGPCAPGYTGFDPYWIGGGGNGRIGMAANSLFMGATADGSSWSNDDKGDGKIKFTYNDEVSNKVCLKVDNVKSFTP